MAFGTTNNNSKDQIILMDGSFTKNFHLRDSTMAQIVSIDVAKVLRLIVLVNYRSEALETLLLRSKSP